MTLLEREKMGCLFKVGSDVKSTDQNKQGTVRILYLADGGKFIVGYRTERFLTEQKSRGVKVHFFKTMEHFNRMMPAPVRTGLSI